MSPAGGKEEEEPRNRQFLTASCWKFLQQWMRLLWDFDNDPKKLSFKSAIRSNDYCWLSIDRRFQLSYASR